MACFLSLKSLLLVPFLRLFILLSLSLPPSSLSSSSSTVLSLPSPTTSPPSFQPIHSTGPPHPPPHQQKVYTLSLSQSSLSILYFNVRSMLSNLSSLTSSVLLSNPDIVCITDTWLSPDILSSEVGIPGFTLFHADHSRHGGGVAIYSKSSLSPVLLPLQSNVIELLIITVQLCSQSLHTVCFYCPSLKPQNLSLLINMLSPLGPAFTSKLLLVGDFNVNVSAYPSPPLMSHITTITSLFSLQQLIQSPTHFSPSGSPSTIDLIFALLSFCSVVTLLSPVVPPTTMLSHLFFHLLTILVSHLETLPH